MNRARLIEVRDFLEENKDRFVYNTYCDAPNIRALTEAQCNTHACVAGWTCALFSPDTMLCNAYDVAKRLLKFNGDQAQAIFMGREYFLTSQHDGIVQMLDQIDIDYASVEDAIERINWMLLMHPDTVILPPPSE